MLTQIVVTISKSLFFMTIHLKMRALSGQFDEAELSILTSMRKLVAGDKNE